MGETQTMLIRYRQHQADRGFSPRTIERRAWSLALWTEHCHLAEVDISTAGMLHVEDFLARWRSPQSRYSVRSDLHQFYVFAIVRGLLDNDPTERVPAPKVPKRSSTPIDPNIVAVLIDSSAGLDRLVLMLAACAGLRISEIAALDGVDVDLEHRVLTVRQGKGGSDSTVPIVDELAVELACWPSAGRLVPMLGASVGDRIRRLLRRNGVAGRPHDLRHTFAAVMHDRLGNLYEVSVLMRHAEVATTQRYVRRPQIDPARISGLYRHEPRTAA
jgi:integrase/recombinase XerD